MLRGIAVPAKPLFEVSTWTLGSKKNDITFESLPGDLARDLRCVVTGVYVRVEGTLNQPSGSDTVTAEELWGLLDKVTLIYDGEDYCSEFEGRDLVNYLIAQNIVTTLRAVDTVGMTDLDSQATDEAIDLTWLLPLAEGIYQPHNREEDDFSGALPRHMLENGGSMAIKLVDSLTGAWDLKSGTTFTVTVWPDIAFVDRTFAVQRPTLIATDRAAGENTYVMPGGDKVRVPTFVAMIDRATPYGAITEATGPVLEVNGKPVARQTSSQLFGKHHSYRAPECLDQLADAMDVYISTAMAPSLDLFPSCRTLKLQDAARQHNAAVRYIARYVRQPSDTEVEEDLSKWSEASKGYAIDGKVQQEIVRDFRTAAVPTENRPSRVRNKSVPLHGLVHPAERQEQMGARMFVFDDR